MIQPGMSDTRHTLPRWNALDVSMALGEMNSYSSTPKTPLQDSEVELEQLLSEWKYEKNLPLAIEIIAISKFTRSNIDISDVRNYAMRLKADGTDLPALVQQFISEESNLPPERVMPLNYRDNIRKTKKALVQFPRNPLMWSELAREYLVSGQINKSKKAMQIALGLAPDNRTVIRSAARLYIHLEDFDRARHYLDNCNLVNVDPWVLASEIAVMNQMERSSRLIKRGREMLLSQNYSPLALSELASELSTMDFSAGNSKQGKRKLQIVQNHLHENAFAQLVWINKNVYNLSSMISEAPRPFCNYEAIARSCYFKGAWSDTLQYAGEWLEYQPFSREPALLSSYVAADLIGDIPKASEAIQCGLKSNPDDSSIVNNYIYVSVLKNDFSTAAAYMRKAHTQFDVPSSVSLTATNGLLLYRTGHPDIGLSKYKEAIAIAANQNDDILQCKAAIYLAREEKRIGHDISSWLKYIDGYAKKDFFNDCLPLIKAFKLRD